MGASSHQSYSLNKENESDKGSCQGGHYFNAHTYAKQQ